MKATPSRTIEVNSGVRLPPVNPYTSLHSQSAISDTSTFGLG